MPSKSKRERQALERKPALVVPFRKPGDTRSVRTLRGKMTQITTRTQFERVIASFPQAHRARARAIMEPMLRPSLPCCAEYMATGDHAQHCPTQRFM